MRARFPLFLVLLSWLMATGSQWDFVQVFAWGRMMTGYVQKMSVVEAVQLTFDGEKPCPICKAVSKAKRAQESTAVPNAGVGAKSILIFQPSPVYVFSRAEVSAWPLRDVVAQGADRAAPPSPPPRLQAV